MAAGERAPGDRFPQQISLPGVTPEDAAAGARIIIPVSHCAKAHDRARGIQRDQVARERISGKGASQASPRVENIEPEFAVFGACPGARRRDPAAITIDNVIIF